MEGMKLNDFALMAFMTNTNGRCSYCDHEYDDLEDVKNRNPVLITFLDEGASIACKKCYDNKRLP